MSRRGLEFSYLESRGATLTSSKAARFILSCGFLRSLCFPRRMSSSSPSSDPKAVTILTSMGFPESKAIVALLRADNDVNRAVELLSAGCKFQIVFPNPKSFAIFDLESGLR